MPLTQEQLDAARRRNGPDPQLVVIPERPPRAWWFGWWFGCGLMSGIFLLGLWKLAELIWPG